MSILYSCVAREHNILVEYTSSREGNFSMVASSALQNISTNSDYKTIYEAEHFLFFVYVKSGVTYLCAADRDFSKGKAYDYLLDIIDKTEACTRDQVDYHQPSELTQQQKNEIAKEMKKSSAKPRDSNLDKLQDDVGELQGIMVQNVNQILSRGDKLDDLMDKSELLEINSHAFQKTTKKIQDKYWYQNLRYKIILGVIIAVIIIVVIVVPIAVSTQK